MKQEHFKVSFRSSKVMKRIGWLLLVVLTSLAFVHAQQAALPPGPHTPRLQPASADRSISDENTFIVGSDGKVRTASGREVSGIKTYHYVKKGSNELVCDQTGEHMAASSIWRD